MNKACTALEGEDDSSLMTQCNSNDDYDSDNSPDTSKYGIPQAVDGDSDSQRKTHAAIAEMILFMEEEVYANDDIYNDSIRSNCRNKHELCAFWASVGECDVNPSYMKINCAPACRTCRQLDVEYRCPMPEDVRAASAFYEGVRNLNDMFEGFISGKGDGGFAHQFHPMIHSAPSGYRQNLTMSSYDNENDDVTNLTFGSDFLVDDRYVEIGGPWIVTFENFLSDKEADHLIDMGYVRGYERSQDVGAAKFDGTYDGVQSHGRTSENAWCQHECEEAELTKLVTDRIARVTGIPSENSEHLQILKYEIGQFYNQHHDYIEYQAERAVGPRVLTFFLYLSDVDEGGETKFNKLGLTIKPKKGRALLWPSVLNRDPTKKDYRTDHQAMPVVRGTKFAANAWLHLREFKDQNNKGCA